MSTSVEMDLELARRHAAEIDAAAKLRRSVPVRCAFAADRSGVAGTMLATLVGSGGRGGEVPLKLYLALIWKCSKAPFNVAIPARKWAELLALPDPSGRGARRVSEAIKTLEAHRLVRVERSRGDVPIVTVLHETGTGQEYEPPKGRGPEEQYFQVPASLWVGGDIQQMSTPALAMLLAVASEQGKPGSAVWWSTEQFPARIGLSAPTRARGTKELVERGLLNVKRQPLSSAPDRSFTRERVRSVYHLTGSALLSSGETVVKKATGHIRRTRVKKVVVPAANRSGRTAG